MKIPARLLLLVSAWATMWAYPAGAEFDPPRIVEVVHTLDSGFLSGGGTDRRCYISQGTDGNVNQGDELNVYRELNVKTRNGRPVRVFIGTMQITESQKGLSIGRFIPNRDLGSMTQVRYKSALKHDIVMPKLVINATALFDPGKTDLKPGVAEEFRKVGEFVQNLAPSRLVIEGHTDADGDETDNQELSEMRAQVVRQYLINTYQFISPAMIQAKGLGEARPLVNNDTPENKALNRRIEIVVWE